MLRRRRVHAAINHRDSEIPTNDATIKRSVQFYQHSLYQINLLLQRVATKSAEKVRGKVRTSETNLSQKTCKKTSINSEKQHATISTAGGLLPPFRRPSALDWQQPARRFPPTRMWWKWTPVADSSRGQTAAPPPRSTDKHSQMCHYVAIPLGNIFNKMYTASQGHNFRGSLHWRSERTL